MWSEFQQNPSLFTRVIAQKSSKIGPIGSRTQKNKGIFRVKLRTTNTQKLKVMDLETMGGWSYYSLCEIFCGPFGLAPGVVNLGPIFQIGPKRTDKFQGLLNF